MANHHKVHELLSASELEELEAFAREPGRTIDECHEWLQARGFVLSRSAVGNWKAKFEERRLAERMHQSGGLAKAFLAAAHDSGGLGVPDAAVLQVAQMIFDRSAALAAEGDVKSEDLAAMSLSLQRLMLAKGRLEKTRTEFLEREKAALDAGAKVVNEGGNGQDVVATIKRALGITVEQ